MVRIRSMEEGDIDFIVSCLDGKDESFAHQCGYGRWHTYPVTKEQIHKVSIERRDNTRYFVIENDDTLIGSVELDFIDWDNKVCSVCRFLIADEYRSKGYGTNALRELVGYAFNVFNMKRVSLTVFNFNIGAFRCYEKAGFKKFDEVVRDNGWVAIKMEIFNDV
ncbi:MAG: GNAT family N-acetyltransferase [Eubacteriales bacterium]